MGPGMLTIANDGSILTYARRNTVSVVDFEKGTTHDLTLPLVSRALAFVDQVWLLGGTAKERELRRVTPAGVPFGEPLLIGDLGPEVTLRPAPIGTPAALLCGRRVVEVHDDCGRLVATPIADARLALPLS